jgi:Kef-type K+ transport system membrane component KefB/Trk K+ transport system NAD-binding subunit
MSFDTTFAEIAAILLAATAVGAIGSWLRQPLIVSFIVVGILVGPAGVGVVTSHEQVELLASIGISLLLFVVGLKLDIHMVRTVGPAAFTAGVAQVGVTMAAGLALALAVGLTPVAATYVALGLTFSSTIIVVKLLSDKREIDALHGRLAVGLLIVQDLAVILVMIGLTAAGSGLAETGPRLSAVTVVAINGLAFLAIVAALGRWVLPALTGRLAKLPELIVLFGIAWALVLAAVGEWLGLSREVGALVAGVSLASTPYRDTLAGRLVTVRDFLLLFFFIDLGTRIDLSLLGGTIGPSLVLSAFVLVGKPVLVMAILGVMGYRKRTGFLTGVTMGQISEFSLILGTLGLSLGHIDVNTMALVTTVGVVTITLSTYVINAAGPIYTRLATVLGIFERRRVTRESDSTAAVPMDTDVILFGLGRYGSGIARHLRLRNRRVIGVDFDPEALDRWRIEKLPVVYGDVADPELLEHLPLDRAKWVVSTTPDAETNQALLRQLQHRGFKGRIAVACRTAEDADRLRLNGADVLLRPFADAAEQAVDAITSGMDRLSAIASSTAGLREVRLGPGSMWAGRTLGDLPLRNEFGVTVLGISRSGRSAFNPAPGFQLFPGDRLILTGDAEQLSSAVEYMARVDFPDETEEERDFSVEELSLDRAVSWHGRTLADLDLRRQFGITVIAVRQGGERLTASQPNRPLLPADRLVVAGRRQAIAQVRAAATADA